jgi:hypothetical protein
VGRRAGASAGCAVLTRADAACRQGSNPLKMGVPKRVPSLNTQVEGNCKELGGHRAIHRRAAVPAARARRAPPLLAAPDPACRTRDSVLVANNGLAAVKFIRSIRSWAYKTFGNERAVALVAMATPEDMRIDAEHIRMADQVPPAPTRARVLPSRSLGSRA